MKFNIKKNGIYSFAFATAVSLTACTGDLKVTPIDPNLDTPENVLTSRRMCLQVLRHTTNCWQSATRPCRSAHPTVIAVPLILRVSTVASVSICAPCITCRNCLPMRQ